VFGSKQPPPGGKPASPFTVFESPRDDRGKKGSADLGGVGRPKQTAAVVAEGTPVRTMPQLLGAVYETKQSLATESYVPPVTQGEVFSSGRTQTKIELPGTAAATSGQVLAARPMAGTVSRDGGKVSVPSQPQPAQPSISSVTQVPQQVAVATPDARQQKTELSGQVNTGVGRPQTTRAEVPPWTQAPTATAAQRKLDSDVTTRVEPATGKATVLPSKTTAAETTTVPASRSAALPTVSSVPTTRGKIVPSPTARVDWAKQRFGDAAQSTDVVNVIPSSPTSKHRAFGVPRPEAAEVEPERVLSNLDDSISKLAAAAATRVVAPSSSAGQEQPRASQTVAVSSGVVPGTSAGVHSPPFKPLTVSPPITVSSRVAIVHGLQMSPPSSTTPPRSGTQLGGSTWSPASTVQQPAGGGGVHPSSSNFATRSDVAFQSTVASPSDRRAAGEPVQPTSIAAQRPSPAGVFSTGAPVQHHVPPTAVQPTAAAAPGVSAELPASRSHPVPTAGPPPPQVQRTTPVFIMEAPVVSPVLARPALPTITARVWQSDVPRIQLSAQPLKPVVVMQSPVPEMVLVAPQKPVPEASIRTSSSGLQAEVAPTRQQQPLSPSTEASRTMSQPIRQTSVPQTQVSTAVIRTQVAVTHGQEQRPAQVGVQQAQAVAIAQAAIPQVHSPRPVQQIPAAAQSSNIQRIESRVQAQPARVAATQIETKSTGVTSGVIAQPAASVGPQRDGTSQIAGGTRMRQDERRGTGTAAVPDRPRDRGQAEQHRDSKPASQVSDRQLTLSSQPQSRGGTAAVADEVDRALRVLDSIAAETRSLSASLSRTTTAPTSSTATTASPLRVQTSQTSTAVVVGSPRDSAAPVPDPQKPRQQPQPKSPRGQAGQLQSAQSLDSSGVIKKHLVHLESLFRPGVGGDPHVKKSVSLRTPRPLRKAQTVDLTTVGIGVDPELMQLLRTRKEKSASDDEDSAAKSRDDAVSATARYNIS